MPIDISMYNQQAPDFLGSFQQGMKISDLARQRKLADKSEADKEAIKKEYQNNTVTGPDGKITLNENGLIAGLAKVSPTEAFAAQDKIRERKAQDYAFQKQKSDAFTQDVARIGGDAVDQPSYERVIDELKNRGHDVSKIDKIFDPQLHARHMQLAQTYSEQVAQQNKDRTSDQKDRELDIKANELGEKRAERLAKRNEGLTEGQKAVDKDFAKEYNDWVSSGRSAVDKNLSRLESAKEALKNDSSLTGGLGGMLPDALRNITNEKAIVTRDNVRAAAQGALKATLGAQFTEKEGERIMNQAYNERLSPKENIAKIQAAIDELSTNRDSIERKRQHFESRGSLRGFEGVDRASRTAGAERSNSKPGVMDSINDALSNKANASTRQSLDPKIVNHYDSMSNDQLLNAYQALKSGGR